MSWEYYYWQCCSNIFLEDCPQGSSVFNPHPPLFLPRFLLSFWQPIIFQPLSSFPPSSQLKLNKHFFNLLYWFFLPAEGPTCEEAVWTPSGRVMLQDGNWQSGLKNSVSAVWGTAYRLLSSSLRCAQSWRTSKILCENKHQPSCFTPNTKSGVAKRRFWWTLVLLLLLTTTSLKCKVDLDEHRAQGCQSLFYMFKIKPLQCSEKSSCLPSHVHSHCFSFFYLFSQQINTNKTKSSLVKFNILSQGWEVPGCRHFCTHWELCCDDYY